MNRVAARSPGSAPCFPGSRYARTRITPKFALVFARGVFDYTIFLRVEVTHNKRKW
ncbi:hypothetical protein FB466_0245 [Klugiella xanthotipulae]|uniref:Uncharacterized protein n=1 Tax=Klugiella xanthotipulae TaxID=244735 RepID=A0A543I4C1_9MICO|nr:hypothetical protein FB466_0245 [Klugiella xanthotipulae]